MQKELYLFIIWPNGRFMEKQIVADIKKKFEIFRIFEVCWKEEHFALNLARFYGKKLPKGCKKEKETGTGSFKIYLVYDNNPQYTDGKNTNIVKKKQEYRQLAGGGNLIHASDNPAETNENLLFLLGKTIKELEQEGPQTNIGVISHDLIGCPTWDSLRQALDTVRKIPFTRVKAYKNSYLIHSRNADLARRLLNASSHFSIPGIHKYSIEVGKTKQPIYIRKIN